MIKKIRPFRLALSLAASGLLISNLISKSNAAPYASDLTNNSGTISFRLNENADNVKIVSSGGAVTNDLGAGVKGLTTTNLGVSGVVKIIVTRSAAAGYVQSSVDGFQEQGVYVNKFEQARGLAVNKNPASPSFGRIYIANGRGQGITAGTFVRTNFQGIYMLNADDTIAMGTGVTPRTAGLPFTAGNTASPMRLTINKDDNQLYICDFSDPSGGLYVTDLDVTTGINVLDHVGDLTTGATNHGSTYGAFAEGSMANGNLKVFTLDEDLIPQRSVWKYDIGTGPLPYAGSPVGPLSTAPIANFVGDLVRGGTNNYFYYSQNRSSGTEANGPGVRIFTEDGTAIADSQAVSRAYLNNPAAADILRNIVALDMSPDGSTLAAMQGSVSGRVYLIPLTNGVFNFAATNSFLVGSVSDNNRDIAFDAAGNIYVINTTGEWFRSFSKGGATVAVTGSDGTFTIGAPATLLSVTGTSGNEQGPTNGVFTLARTGDVSGTLTVPYTISGVASNGVDYTLLSGTVTFAAGAATTNVIVSVTDDSIAEPTETVILTILGGANYGVGSPNSATISILDNETPVVNIASIQPKLLEGYAQSRATFRLTRLGLLSSALTVNVGYSGTAVRGTDYNGTLAATINANAATGDFSLTPIDNQVYAGNKTITATLASGSGYTIGATNSANATLIDDEFPTATTLFSDNFDNDNSGQWTATSADGFNDSTIEWAYDYSADGIPSAPHSTGGSTRGVKFRVNFLSTTAAGTATALIISPNGLSLDGNYRLIFDSWLNYCGPIAAGGRGSTQNGTAAVLTSGNTPLVDVADAAIELNKSSADGVWFSWDNDGGVGTGTAYRDYNAYAPTNVGAATASILPESKGVYAAGTDILARDNNSAYYAPWGGVTAPALQVSTYPGPAVGLNQPGTTAVGSFGFAWHTVALTKQGTNVVWTMDGVVIATVGIDTNSFTYGSNVAVGYEDAFASVTDNVNVSFGLFDNLRIESLPSAPPAAAVITSIQVVGGNVVINFTGGASDSASAFSLVSSATLSSSATAYGPVSGANVTGGAGSFQVTAPVSGTTRFYLIKR